LIEELTNVYYHVTYLQRFQVVPKFHS